MSTSMVSVHARQCHYKLVREFYNLGSGQVFNVVTKEEIAVGVHRLFSDMEPCRGMNILALIASEEVDEEMGDHALGVADLRRRVARGGRGAG
ncbi:MAG TPA: hypothetical protein VMV72_20245 [Verrucomicrobiae bacterium]|nr:hypothetical protein [Verrucomicrobiae bacterium]